MQGKIAFEWWLVRILYALRLVQAYWLDLDVVPFKVRVQWRWSKHD